jgi:Tol biopolymer transport system component
MTRRTALALILALASCSDHPAGSNRADEEGEASVTQVTSGRRGDDKDPEISPDGKTLYYSSSSFGDQMDLFMKTIGSSTAVRLTTFPGDKRFPKVNRANPRFLAFSTNTRGNWEIAIIDVLGDPSRVEFVSEPEAQSLHPSWSPDGRQLVYCSSGSSTEGDWTLKIRDFTTGKTYSFEDIDGLLPDWSPLGNRILFQRMKHRDRWLSSLWTLDFQDGMAKHLTSVFSSDDWAAINPSWSPDGRQIVFATVGKSPKRMEILSEGDDIWTIDADGSHPCRLTTSSAADWLPTWASNGSIYFVSDRSGTSRIWSLKAPVTGSPLEDFPSAKETHRLTRD